MKRQSHAGRALALFFSVAGIAVAVIYVLANRTPAAPVLDLSLPTDQKSVEAWAKQDVADRAQREGLTFGAQEEAVRAALERFNEEEYRTSGDPASPAYRKAQGELKQALHRYVNDFGVKRYRALGLHLREEFTAALDTALQRVQASGERAALFLERHPLDEDAKRLKAWAGNFLDHAVRTGLILEDGRVADGGERIPGLFFLVRWFYWAHPITDYTFQLSDIELVTFWAWKAERSTALDLGRRFELLEQIERVAPDYPVEYVRGILLAREERWRDAAERWRRWLVEHPDDDRARENLRYAEEMIKAAQP